MTTPPDPDNLVSNTRTREPDRYRPGWGLILVEALAREEERLAQEKPRRRNNTEPRNLPDCYEDQLDE